MGHGQVECDQCKTWLILRLSIFLPLLTHRSADSHGHGLGSHAAHGPEGGTRDREDILEKTKEDDVESNDHQPEHLNMDDSAAAHIIGVIILEFGVVLHR